MARDLTTERLLNPAGSNSTQNFYGRNRQQESFPSGPSNGDIHSILLSMSCSLSDMQRQLVNMQEQNSERDSTMKKLLEEVHELKEKQPSPSTDQAPKSKRCRKSPRGLSACVRRVHGAFNEIDKYHGNEGINSDHNKVVTQKVVEDIIASGEFLEADRVPIQYAAKKHHEYLVRLNKTETEEAKEKRLKTSRLVQRRVRLYERRISQANKRESQILRQLGEKLMSDEESDSDDPTTLIKRSPPWRSEKLNLLFKSLDSRYDSSHTSVTKRTRKTGQVTERLLPQGLPLWAIITPATSSEAPEHGIVNTPSATISTSPSITPTAPSACSTPNSVPVWQPGQNLPISTPVRDRPPSIRRSFCNAVFMPPSDHTPPPAYTPPSTFTPPTYTPPSRSMYPSSNTNTDESSDEDDRELNDWIRAVSGSRQ